MGIFTVTICDENVPNVSLCMNELDRDNRLLDHYLGVWEETAAPGSPPPSWPEISQCLHALGLLQERHIAHVTEHDLFAQGNAA